MWFFELLLTVGIIFLIVATHKSKQEGRVATKAPYSFQRGYQQVSDNHQKVQQIEQERQRQEEETRHYLRQRLTDDANYQKLANFEDRYYATIVDKDFKQLGVAQELTALSTVQGRVAYLKKKDPALLKASLDFLMDYRKNYPQASLSECREAFLTAVGRPYYQDWARPDYFLDTAEEITYFFAGRKPNNGRRLIMIERSKDQLQYFGFSHKDVRSWEQTDQYGAVVFVAYHKKLGYELVYRLTEYDRFVHLSESFKEMTASKAGSQVATGLEPDEEQARPVEQVSKVAEPSAASLPQFVEREDIADELQLILEELKSDTQLFKEGLQEELHSALEDYQWGYRQSLEDIQETFQSAQEEIQEEFQWALESLQSALQTTEEELAEELKWRVDHLQSEFQSAQWVLEGEFEATLNNFRFEEDLSQEEFRSAREDLYELFQSEATNLQEAFQSSDDFLQSLHQSSMESLTSDFEASLDKFRSSYQSSQASLESTYQASEKSLMNELELSVSLLASELQSSMKTLRSNLQWSKDSLQLGGKQVEKTLDKAFQSAGKLLESEHQSSEDSLKKDFQLALNGLQSEYQLSTESLCHPFQTSERTLQLEYQSAVNSLNREFQLALKTIRTTYQLIQESFSSVHDSAQVSLHSELGLTPNAFLASKEDANPILLEGHSHHGQGLMVDVLDSRSDMDLTSQASVHEPSVSSPPPAWYDDVQTAIKEEKLPILKDGREVRTIDWLTEPSLPVFSGVDVYRFATDLDTLGNIMMIVGKHFVGQPAGDWIRYINEKTFGRKRMTQGYKEIYRRALLRLEERKLIILRQGIVSAVASKEEPILTKKRLPKALQS